MRRDDRSPEAYRDSVFGVQREMLEVVREVILEIAPDVEEGIGHGMLDFPGLANLAAQKHHVSLYVIPAVLDRHRAAFPRRQLRPQLPAVHDARAARPGRTAGTARGRAGHATRGELSSVVLRGRSRSRLE